jgi:hypothetical protein
VQQPRAVAGDDDRALVADDGVVQVGRLEHPAEGLDHPARHDDHRDACVARAGEGGQRPRLEDAAPGQRVVEVGGDDVDLAGEVLREDQDSREALTT